MADRNRVVSGALAAGWLVFLFLLGGGELVMRGVLALILPLACIWFPDAMGGMTTRLPSPVSTVPITGTSPACIVRILGWVMLLLFLALPLLLRLAG